MKEKIAADGKRHRCYKTEKQTDAVRAGPCNLEWNQFYLVVSARALAQALDLPRA